MKHGTDLKLKFLKLQKRLDVPKYVVKGILQSVWDFTAENAVHGNIGKHSNVDIAIGIEWDGDPDDLISALVETQWLDEHENERLIVHHWLEHCESWIKKRIERSKNANPSDDVRRTADNGGQRRTTSTDGRLDADGIGKDRLGKAGIGEAKATGKDSLQVQKQRKPREPDPIWDTVAAVWFPSGVPPSQNSRVGAIVRDLKAVHATPEEIRRRSANCRARFEGKASVNALAKHWDLCKDVPPRPERLGKVEVEPGKYDNVKIMRAGPYRGPSGDGSVQPSQAAGNTGARGTG